MLRDTSLERKQCDLWHGGTSIDNGKTLEERCMIETMWSLDAHYWCFVHVVYVVLCTYSVECMLNMWCCVCVVCVVLCTYSVVCMLHMCTVYIWCCVHVVCVVLCTYSVVCMLHMWYYVHIVLCAC